LPSEDEGIKLYKINPKAKSTVLLYNKKAVTAKFVDYDAKRDNLEFTKQIEKVWSK
jgi:hypothetical protein